MYYEKQLVAHYVFVFLWNICNCQVGNSMPNHLIFLDVDTLTSQILFISFTICRPCWNDQSLKISVLNSLWFQSYWDLKMWPKWVFRDKIHYFEFVFCNNYCSSHPFILKFGTGKFFEVRNPKITLRRLKNKPILRYLRFQVLGTCDRTNTKKYMWPNR